MWEDDGRLCCNPKCWKGPATPREQLKRDGRGMLVCMKCGYRSKKDGPVEEEQK